MPIAVLIIGVFLIVVAVKNTQTALFSAIKQDVPEFAVWAGAIVALGVVGYIPGLRPISRGLLILVLLVIVVNNYQGIQAGFSGLANRPKTGAGSGGGSAGAGGSKGTGSVIESVIHDAIIPHWPWDAKTPGAIGL